MFKKCANELMFTVERAVNNRIRHLDLGISSGVASVCWEFELRAMKGLLPYYSAHSNLVKRAITTRCLGTVLNKSCHHCMEASFTAQVTPTTGGGVL